MSAFGAWVGDWEYNSALLHRKNAQVLAADKTIILSAAEKWGGLSFID